mgnify:CR=1 FL=1
MSPKASASYRSVVPPPPSPQAYASSATATRFETRWFVGGISSEAHEQQASMYVQDDHIFTGGEYIFNHFYQLKDTAFFMSNDRINDLTSEFVTGGSRAEAVLACQDRMIRVLTGSDLLYEVSIDGPAVTIERYHNPVPSAGAPSQGFGPSSPSAAQVQNDGRFKELLYGTENGLIGQLLLDASMMRRGWVVDPALEGRRGKAAHAD